MGCLKERLTTLASVSDQAPFLRNVPTIPSDDTPDLVSAMMLPLVVQTMVDLLPVFTESRLQFTLFAPIQRTGKSHWAIPGDTS